MADDAMPVDVRITEREKTTETGRGRAFTVAVRTPAGHEHSFRVNGELQVDVLVTRSVEYFIAHGELAAGRYLLGLLREGAVTDMTGSAQLEDYGVHEGDVLVLLVGDPQVDG